MAVLMVALIVADGASAEQAGSSARSLQAGWLDAGANFACAITAGGGAVCWGADDHGELGNGPAISGIQVSPTPVALPPGRRAVAISASSGSNQNHACAVLDDGSAVCWGSDQFGQLGNGPGASGDQQTPTPVLLPPGRRATAISAGSVTTCAVLDDGGAACWGDDAEGALGNGPAVTGDQQAPTAVLLPSGRTATAISAGDDDACAVLDDASLVCWGSDANAALGNGPGLTGDQSSPGPVVLPPVNAISAGDSRTCAVLTDGGAMCWGSEFGGGLGDGVSTNTYQASPVAVKVPAPYKATAISVGHSETCVALDDRQVMCFGLRYSGELGDGVLLPGNPLSAVSTPVFALLPPQRSETAITVGSSAFACAALDSGSVVCWGTDAVGTLGNGALATADQADPRTVPLTLSNGSIPAFVANLSVTITPATSVLAPGQIGRFTVRVANSGPDAATGVVVGLRADGAGIIPGSPSRGTVTGGSWSVGAIARGDQATLVVNARAATARPATLTAEVNSADQPDPNSTPGNGRAGEDDQASATIGVPPVAPAAGAGAAPRGAAGAAGAAVRRLRPRGLTLRVTRVGRRLRVSGALAIPRTAPCRGLVVITARHGARGLRRVGARLARRRAGCVYSALLPATGLPLRLTARFTGSARVLAAISPVRRA